MHFSFNSTSIITQLYKHLPRVLTCLWPVFSAHGASSTTLVAPIARCDRDVQCDSNPTPPNRYGCKNGLSLSGTKNEPKPKLFGPDIFRWSRGLPRERVGAKKFDTSLETREIKLFGRDIPGFCRDIPELPEKFEKKKFVFNSCPLFLGCHAARPIFERMPGNIIERLKPPKHPIFEHDCIHTYYIYIYLIMCFSCCFGAEKITSTVLKGRNCTKIQHQYW